NPISALTITTAAFRPGKRSTASAAPSGRPKPVANSTAVRLMLSDNQTIASKVGSPDKTSCQAATRASTRSGTGEPLPKRACLIHHTGQPGPIWYLMHIGGVALGPDGQPKQSVLGRLVDHQGAQFLHV